MIPLPHGHSVEVENLTEQDAKDTDLGVYRAYRVYRVYRVYWAYRVYRAHRVLI